MRPSPLLLPPSAADPARLRVNVAALDPSPTSTGWATWVDGNLAHGTRRWKDDAIADLRDEGANPFFWWGRALLLFRRWLTHVLTNLPIDELWVERPALSPKAGLLGTARVVTLHGFAEAIVCELCAHGARIGFQGTTGRQAVFKWATGDGRAEKVAILEAVRSWGIKPDSQDAAMAIALLRYAQR